MAFWRYNGDQNTILTLCICPVCIVHSFKACSFQRSFSKLTPLAQTCFRNHIIPSATVGFDNFPNSLHRGTHHDEVQCVVSLLSAVLRISSLPSTGRMGHCYNEAFSLSFCWCHSAALRAAKATGMSGRLLANVKLTLDQRPLKFRRQIYLSYGFNKIKQISTSC